MIYGCERHSINALNLATIDYELTTTHTQTLSLSHSNDPSVQTLSCPLSVALVDDGTDIGLTISGTTLQVTTSDET